VEPKGGHRSTPLGKKGRREVSLNSLLHPLTAQPAISPSPVSQQVSGRHSRYPHSRTKELVPDVLDVACNKGGVLGGRHRGNGYTGGLPSLAVPGPDNMTASKTPAFAGPTLADMKVFFSPPPTAASNADGSSSRTPAVRARSRSVPPPIGALDFFTVSPLSP
jgi:hypothetical protein